LNKKKDFNKILKLKYTKYIDVIDLNIYLYIILEHIETKIKFPLLLKKDKRGIFLLPEYEKEYEKKIKKYRNKENQEKTIIREVFSNYSLFYNYIF